MATVSYTGTLAVNPSLDEVLDPSGTIITQTDTIFEIENATGGEWNGFVFRVEGSGLAYPDDLSGSFGSVTAINVFDPNASLVATVSYQTAWGGYESPSFLSFWLSLNSVGATAAKALDQLFLSPTSGHTTQGSDNSDHLTTYGQTGNVVLYGNAGDDVLLSRLSTNFATLVGGTADDTFRFSPDSSGMPLNSINVAGSSQDGSGGEGEFNTIELIKGQYSIMSATDIDGLTFVGGGSKFLTIHANQIGNGRLSSTLAVTGDDAGEGRITIQNVNGNPVDLNLSGWTFINWNSPAPIQINLSGDLYAPTNNRVIATSLADSILGGLGHDTLDGGLGNDTIDGWQGNDSLIGGDGDDLLRDHGPGSNTLDGGAGNDRLEVNGSSDNRLSGGSGNDFLRV